MNANEIIEEIKRQAIEEHKNAVAWYVYAMETDNEKRANMYLGFSRDASSKEETLCRLLNTILDCPSGYAVFMQENSTDYKVCPIESMLD